MNSDDLLQNMEDDEYDDYEFMFNQSEARNEKYMYNRIDWDEHLLACHLKPNGFKNLTTCQKSYSIILLRYLISECMKDVPEQVQTAISQYYPTL